MICSCRRSPAPSQPTNHFWEKPMREVRWKHFRKALGVCHRPGCAVPDTGCAETLIGQGALERHVEVCGREPRWLSNVCPVTFRGFDDQHSAIAGNIRIAMGFGRQDDSLCGTHGSWEFGAVAEPHRLASPGSHRRPEKRQDSLGEPDGNPETFHDSSTRLI